MFGDERTSALEDEVNLHGIVLIVDAVLTRSVEVELGKLVGVVLCGQGTVGQDDLETRAQVLKLGLVGMGHMEVNIARLGVVNVIGFNDDGRLVLAL